LRNNPFLFTAFIHSRNYRKFENEVLSTTVLTKKKLLELFNKYYNLLELKILAEDKIRTSRGNINITMRTDEIKDINFERLRDELTKIASTTKTEIEIQRPIEDRTLRPHMPISDYQLSELPPLAQKLADNPEILQDKNLSELRSFFQSKLEKFDDYADVNKVYNNTTVGNIYSQLGTDVSHNYIHSS
jgi:hypothetical protein